LTSVRSVHVAVVTGQPTESRVEPGLGTLVQVIRDPVQSVVVRESLTWRKRSFKAAPLLGMIVKVETVMRILPVLLISILSGCAHFSLPPPEVPQRAVCYERSDHLECHVIGSDPHRIPILDPWMGPWSDPWLSHSGRWMPCPNGMCWVPDLWLWH